MSYEYLKISGSCAVFTEQGSSTSQMTAAKVMDVIARLPDCTKQAADAVSAYTEVKIGVTHANDFRQYCHVGNTAKQCRLGLFQDSDFARDLEDSKYTSGGVLCIFGSRPFVPVSLDVQKANCCLAQFNRV